MRGFFVFGAEIDPTRRWNYLGKHFFLLPFTQTATTTPTTPTTTTTTSKTLYPLHLRFSYPSLAFSPNTVSYILCLFRVASRQNAHLFADVQF